MFVKDNISFSRKYTRICGAETCCMILNTRNNSDIKLRTDWRKQGLS